MLAFDSPTQDRMGGWMSNVQVGSNVIDVVKRLSTQSCEEAIWEHAETYWDLNGAPEQHLAPLQKNKVEKINLRQQRPVTFLRNSCILVGNFSIAVCNSGYYCSFPCTSVYYKELTHFKTGCSVITETFPPISVYSSAYSYASPIHLCMLQ